LNYGKLSKPIKSKPIKIGHPKKCLHAGTFEEVNALPSVFQPSRAPHSATVGPLSTSLPAQCHLQHPLAPAYHRLRSLVS
jgi:hypothetical protein